MLLHQDRHGDVLASDREPRPRLGPPPVRPADRELGLDQEHTPGPAVAQTTAWSPTPAVLTATPAPRSLPLPLRIGHETARKGMISLSDPLRTIGHMVDRSSEAEQEARRARAHAALDAVLDVDPVTASGPELTAAIVSRAQLSAIVDGAVVAMIPPWEASADWAADGTATAVTAVVNRTGAHRSAAAALRRTGLDAASMPYVSAAARDGSLPLSHLHLLAKARRPEVAEVFDRDEAALVAEARTRTADSLAAWLRAWRYGALEEQGVNEPDTPLDHDSEADTARIVTGFAGRGLVTLDLTAVSLATIVEAVEARIETWRRTGQLTEDSRSYQELVGAAIVDLVVDGSTSSRRGQLRPLLIVTAKLTELFGRAGITGTDREAWSARILGGGPIGRAALRELMEQANLQLVVTDDDGEPLHVGRTRRLATAAMLIALLARARRGCEFPGCHASHHRAHAHHITWWEHGGCTGIDNLTSCQHALLLGAPACVQGRLRYVASRDRRQGTLRGGGDARPRSVGHGHPRSRGSPGAPRRKPCPVLGRRCWS